jgi:hypothetical protein
MGHSFHSIEITALVLHYYNRAIHRWLINRQPFMRQVQFCWQRF